MSEIQEHASGHPVAGTKQASTALSAPPVRQVLGVPLHALSMGDTVERCRQAIATRTPLAIGVVNVAKLVNMRSDPALRDSVLGSDLVLADGLPVVWASRVLGAPLPERVAGIDLFTELLALADREGYRVYLLGAEPEVLAALVSRIEREHPGLCIAGSRDGYFDDDEAPAVAASIAAARADLLFVGISSPKKEIFLGRFAETMAVPVCHGVGGSFDVLAGKTRRAPGWMQRFGLEWLYRLLQEPRRMWRRYLVTNSRFLFLVGRELLGRGRGSGAS